MGNKIMNLVGPTRKIFSLGASRLVMNNLSNYFGLVIMGGQVCRLDQILDFK
jgi:hypothetical protein